MSTKAVGVCSDWRSRCDALCDGGQSMEHNWVWSGLTKVGDIGGYDVVGWSRVGHVISGGFYRSVR